MKRLVFLLMTFPANAQEMSIIYGPDGSTATELSYPNQSFIYTQQGTVTALRMGDMTIYNGPNGEYLGSVFRFRDAE